MSRKESIILIFLILIFSLINISNYLESRSNSRYYQLIIKEEAKQISINSASLEEIELLPGIGPALARRIIEYRERNGGFKEISEIKKVKGIGEKLFEKIRPYIKL
ncbi:MAG: helix-hairpin-helix domain-containing protein [candidate division WOR-3 bacterium]|nr:helix-hairpin-helix domain-containing protein [candidate division WOR-3 bacterium]